MFIDSHGVDTLHFQLFGFHSLPRSSPIAAASPPKAVIIVSKVISYVDKFSDGSRFLLAKKKKLERLIKKDIWIVVCKTDLTDNTNAIGGHFVLCIKSAEADNLFYKARFISQKYIDLDKDSIFHDSMALQESSIKVILALAATFGFHICSTEIT